LFVGFMPSSANGESSVSKERPPQGESLPFGLTDVSARLDAHREGGLNE
jgi:hypothetical protein